MRILYILALLSFAAAFPSPVRPSKLARRRVVVVKVHKPYPHPDMPTPKTSKTLTNTQDLSTIYEESGTTSYEESTTSTTTSITESVTSTTSTTSETTSTSSNYDNN
ncbi:hypothetical protein BDR26DRAFT_931423 [Obelidium mucronatum]|nr:hypothetical protein BDR26DRAFT_931423 [Obelidium mucronatum]